MHFWFSKIYVVIFPKPRQTGLLLQGSTVQMWLGESNWKRVTVRLNTGFDRLTLIMKELGFFQTSGTTYPTHSHIPEGLNLQKYRCESLKSPTEQTSFDITIHYLAHTDSRWKVFCSARWYKLKLSTDVLNVSYIRYYLLQFRRQHRKEEKFYRLKLFDCLKFRALNSETHTVPKTLFIVPTDAQYYKIIEMLNNIKIIILAQTYFGSRRNHHQGAVLCLAKTTITVLLCSSV